MSAAPELYAGIMSGTSLDGIDIAIASFSDSVQCSYHESFPFSEGERKTLFHFATASTVELDELIRWHFLLAKLYAEAVEKTLARNNLSATSIKAIGLHGQTIRHLPQPVDMDGGHSIQATFQLGSGAALAAITGIDVVSDFRSGDIAAGGQGAPLVPMFDAIFLRDDSLTRIALNIGGISNVTIIPARSEQAKIIAFDTGPGNMLIDALMIQYFGLPYDDGGKISASGTVDRMLLDRLLSDPYYKKQPPKSTGREQFGSGIIEQILSSEISKADAIATVTELTAITIAEAINNYQGELIVSGGGSNNTLLMERLAQLLPKLSIRTPEEFGIPSQAKEAIAFAYFAKAYLENTMIHLRETTGARRPLILGSHSNGSVWIP